MEPQSLSRQERTDLTLLANQISTEVDVVTGKLATIVLDLSNLPRPCTYGRAIKIGMGQIPFLPSERRGVVEARVLTALGAEGHKQLIEGEGAAPLTPRQMRRRLATLERRAMAIASEISDLRARLSRSEETPP